MDQIPFLEQMVRNMSWYKFFPCRKIGIIEMENFQNIILQIEIIGNFESQKVLLISNQCLESSNSNHSKIIFLLTTSHFLAHYYSLGYAS